MDGRRQKDRRRRVIKLRESSNKPVELTDFDAPLINDAVEHIALIEPLHEHEPIDRGSGTTNREAIAGNYQRQNVEINVGRERAIEPQLGTAGGLPPRHARKVEIGKAHWLFELVDPVADQKDP